VPIAVVAGALDVVVIHPVSVIDDACDDVRNIVWDDSGLGYVSRCGAAPYRIVATAVVFPTCWAARAMFAIPSARARRAREQSAAELRALRIKAFVRDIASPTSHVRIAAARDLPTDERDWRGVPVIPRVVAACTTFESDAEFCTAAMTSLNDGAVRHMKDGAAAYPGQVDGGLALIDRTARLAARKEPGLRKAALALLRAFADAPHLMRLRRAAHAKLFALYDLYVKEVDHVSEMTCCGRVPAWRPPGTAVVDLVMARHVVFSLERRGSPAYAAWIEFLYQLHVLEAEPGLAARAVREGWRAASGVGKDWGQRVYWLLAGERPRVGPDEAKRVARTVLGVRTPTEHERRLLFARPGIARKIAEEALKTKLDGGRRLEVTELIGEFRTQEAAVRFVDGLAGLSDEEFAIFRDSMCGTFGRPAPRRP